MPLLLNIKFSEALTKIRNKLTAVVGVPRQAFDGFSKSGQIEQVMRDVIQHNLDTEGDGRWEVLKEATIKNKIRLKRPFPEKILEATGDSKRGALAPGGVKAQTEGSNQIRASIQGEPGRIFGYHARGIPGRLPVRNVLALRDEDTEKLTEGYKNSLDNALRDLFEK